MLAIPAGRGDREMVLLSLDIDGTLEVGDPPGRITLEWVRRAQAAGLWSDHAVEVAFVGHKHKLDEIRARFPEAQRWIHIGDGEADHLYAIQHGFEFHWVHEMPEDGTPGWIL
jgi:hypothetical protein